MTIPPLQQVTQQKLNEMFNSGGWEERLKTCRVVEKRHLTTPLSSLPLGTIFIRKKYYEQAHDPFPVAVLILYVDPNFQPAASGRPIPKGLLENGTWYHV
jgi:hypothetical protein